MTGRSLAGTAGAVSVAADFGVSFLPKKPPKTEFRLLALDVVVAVAAAGVLEITDVGVTSAAPSPVTTDLGSMPVVGAVAALPVAGTADVEASTFLSTTGSPMTRDAVVDQNTSCKGQT